MEINGRRIANVGIFQTTKGAMIGGTYFLFTFLLMTVIAVAQFFAGDTLMFILLLLVGVMLAFAGVSNIVICLRMKSEDFTKGETCEILVLEGTDRYTKYVAFVEPDGRCSNHADTVSEEPKDTAE